MVWLIGGNTRVTRCEHKNSGLTNSMASMLSMYGTEDSPDQDVNPPVLTLTEFAPGSQDCQGSNLQLLGLARSEANVQAISPATDNLPECGAVAKNFLLQTGVQELSVRKAEQVAETKLPSMEEVF